ncbi:MAG: hypothetical protein QOI95_3597 [Acidimicrobiaceae bacterium]|jgi:hypothetical protein
MKSPFRRRLGAAATATLMAVSGTGGAVALAVVGAGPAFAAYPGPTHVTYNNNICTNAASPNSPAGAAISLGANQNYAGIAVDVDTATGLAQPGGVTVGAALPNGSGLAPTAGILQGGTGTLTNVGGDGFVSAAFLQAGVGLGLIHIGDNIPAAITTTIDAFGGATFVASAGVTILSPTQAQVTGTGGGAVVGTVGPPATVTAPLDAQVAYPDIKYLAPNDPSVNVYFAEDAPTIGSTPPSNGQPGQGQGVAADSSVHVVATLPIGPLGLGCAPGTAPSPQTVPVSFTLTPQSDVNVFAAVDVQPALPPTLVPQTIATVNKGGQVTVHAGAGATDNVPITSYQLAAPFAAHGNVVINALTGDAVYTNDGTGAGGSDTFGVTATSSGGTSAPATIETITLILDHAPSCDATSPGPTCHLDQVVVVPVFGADLTMSQFTGLPADVLGKTVTPTGCNGAIVTLNGQPQLACGAMWPVTVDNARGTDAPWSLTGQVTDFLDAVAPVGTTCDTPATYNNHCIPGGNLSWIPVAGVGHGIVPGDVAQVGPGTAILNIGISAPSLLNTAALGNATAGPFGVGAGQAIAAFSAVPGHSSLATQTNPVVEPASYAGLHDAAQTLCSAASTHSGGTFICGAALVVAVPASAAAAPFNPATGTGGYQASLTLTLA